MKIHLILPVCLISIQTFSQAPHLEWENTIGGYAVDQLNSTIATTDGGYILCGSSTSDAGLDKSENNFGDINDDDIWIVKIDATGNIMWENTIGGTMDDIPYKIIQTTDGGYFISASSYSGVSGDKTQINKGSTDYWLIKLNSSGAIEWQKDYGGNSLDYPYAAIQTSDGGYLVGGYSESDISGNKTEPCNGGYGKGDFWILKLKSNGAITWQNTIGGSQADYCRTVCQMAGGYMVGGTSASGITGDKTEAVSGSNDYWALKLDNSGNIAWQNTIGGSGGESLSKIVPTTSGNFLLVGDSDSGISGDKTTPNYGYYDNWMVLINKLGAIKWQKTYGTSASEGIADAVETPDGGFFIGSVSGGNHNAVKSEDGLGGTDYWFLKTNSSGNLIWENTIGGNFYDYVTSVINTSDGNYLAGGYSESPISFSKNEPKFGYNDYWVMKLSPCTSSTETCNYFDDDCDDIIDDGFEDPVSAATIDGLTADIYCEGDAIELVATHGTGNIQWLKTGQIIPGATNDTYIATASSEYTAYVTNCGAATLSNIVALSVGAPATSTITAAGPTTFCMGGNVTLNVSTCITCTYQWVLNGVNIPGATASSYVATAAGIYQCIVTRPVSGCTKLSNPITVSTPCKEGDKNVINEISFSIYPNPNNGTFNIYADHLNDPNFVLDTEIIEFSIYNSIGQMIYSGNLKTVGDNINKTIELNDIPRGIYTITINDGARIANQKIVINQ